MDRRAFLVSLPAGLAMQPRLAAEASSGFQLRLRQEKTEKGRPLFEVTFLNRTTSPLALDLGIVLWGERKYAGNIQFTLRDSNGRVRLLSKRDPQYVAGWAAPYIVEVSPRSAFHLSSIDLIDYWSHEPELAVLHLPAEQYALMATFQGRDPNNGFVAAGQAQTRRWPGTFWTGDLNSNSVDVTLRSPI